MEKKTVKLKEPIHVGSEVISELHFRKPKARDLKVMKGKGGMSDLLDLAAALSDQPPSVIGEMGIDDTMEVVQVIGVFMNVGPQTGEQL